MAGDGSALTAPVIVIGAARSGTKLLRDLMAGHNSLRAVPYDVNYIWRLGNERHASDELPAESCREPDAVRIRTFLAGYARGGATVVEKTVSNTLRVGFVDRVVPDARYIHLVRDGRDVVASSYAQWQARPDWRYMLGKARQYPLGQAPAYALQQAVAVMRRMRPGAEKALPVWGPRYAGIDEDLRTRTLVEVCALQWVHCVDRALDQLALLPPERTLTIHYAEFVTAPRATLERIAGFLGIDPDPYRAMQLGRVDPSIGGSFRHRLDGSDIDRVLQVIGPAMARLKYEM